MNTYVVCSVTFLVMVFVCSILEHLLHFNVMHKPITIFGKKIDTFFIAHAKIHHQIFGCDHTYHLQDEKDKATITMSWYHGVGLAVLSSSIGFVAGIVIGLFDQKNFLHLVFVTWLTSLLTVYAYYCVYESTHWFMHLREHLLRKEIRFVERFFAPLKWLNGHHILHHRFMGKNLNVVFPFADWMFGTLLLRSPVKFMQPRGSMVPDVQPKVNPFAAKPMEVPHEEPNEELSFTE